MKGVTDCPQQTLRLLNGSVTSEETNEHHDGSNSYQDVHTWEQRGCQTGSTSSAPLGGRSQRCMFLQLFLSHDIIHILKVNSSQFLSKRGCRGRSQLPVRQGSASWTPRTSPPTPACTDPRPRTIPRKHGESDPHPHTCWCI